MKSLILPTILLLCFSCSGNRTNEEKETLDSIFGNRIIAADFLEYADSNKIAEQTEHIKKDFDIYDEQNNKILYFDAEELAEFNFDFFLSRLNVILGKRHFHLNLQTAEDYKNSQEVFLNGEKIQLYTDEEFEKGNFQDKAARKFFRKLNELLKKEHSEESFFLLYNDNDLVTLLLTNKQQQIIAERYKDESFDVPYRP